MKTDPTVPNGHIIYAQLVQPYDTLVFGIARGVVLEMHADSLKGEVTLRTEEATYVFTWGYEIEVLRANWIDPQTRFERDVL
jgi:hypothetical protein